MSNIHKNHSNVNDPWMTAVTSVTVGPLSQREPLKLLGKSGSPKELWGSQFLQQEEVAVRSVALRQRNHWKWTKVAGKTMKSEYQRGGELHVHLLP